MDTMDFIEDIIILQPLYRAQNITIVDTAMPNGKGCPVPKWMAAPFAAATYQVFKLLRKI